MIVTPKQQILGLLSQLPDDCSFSEIQAQIDAYTRQSHHSSRGLPSPSLRWRNRETDSERAAFEAWQALVGI